MVVGQVSDHEQELLQEGESIIVVDALGTAKLELGNDLVSI